MKKGFTIIEVSILFVIFLIVAFLVAPLSLDDTVQAKNTSRWRRIQEDFSNIFYSINTQKEEANIELEIALDSILKNEIKSEIPTYKITYMNGSFPDEKYKFKTFYTTYSDSTLGYKIFDSSQNELKGILMYDINGKNGPNKWGKDVFGYNMYSNNFEPFCKTKTIHEQKKDCSKNGTGICCSNYFLIGGQIE